MFSRFPVRSLCAALLLAAALRGAETNVWPLAVQQVAPDGNIESAEYLGPLVFHKISPDGVKMKGIRPLYLETVKGSRETSYLLYPVFSWQKEDDYRYFTFFELINFRRQTDAGRQTSRGFDVWPIYFSRDTGDPATSYRALFPLVGTLKDRLGYDQIKFVLFPLYADLVKSGGHTTHAPWPFLRFIHGADEHGFEFWPLYGHRGRAEDYDSQFFLWPLFYKSTSHLSEPQPSVNLGALPFYSRDTRPGSISENYLWPFFGYTHQTTPAKYDETRYFWPFLVQGRGEVHYVNRWGPFYTHSINKGEDKTWLAWPIFRYSRWEEGGLSQRNIQVLFRIFWSLSQRSLTNPAAAPAYKTHFWPLASFWDNGAGRRQIQLLSPFEVFFPDNEPIRQLYTPLLAIYRYEQRAPGDTSHSMLFSLVSWKKSPTEKEFHFGPLYSQRSTADQARIALGLGLVAWQRQPDTGRWKFSLFNFRSPSASPAPAAPSP